MNENTKVEITMPDDLIEELCKKSLIKIVDSLRRQFHTKQKIYEKLLSDIDEIYHRKDVVTLAKLAKGIHVEESILDENTIMETITENLTLREENDKLKNEINLLK